MKKTVLGVLCLVFALVMFASAAPFSNTIKVNLLGGIGVEYETKAPAGLSSTLGSIIKPLTKTTPKISLPWFLVAVSAVVLVDLALFATT